jgi:hypothetical protein
MKPFDLEKALAGAKVVTRDGREVTQLTRFDVYGNYPLIGIINKQRESFQLNGQFGDNKESNWDLFMAPEKKSIWINVYEDNLRKQLGIVAHCSLDQAIKHKFTPNGFDYIKTVEITNEP